MNQLTENPPTVAIRRKFHIGTGRTGHRVVRDIAPPAPPPEGHIPRISRLMALAIRFEQLIRDGTVHDQADLARLAHISRARVTQIMDLLLLAPEIQEGILFLSPVESGKGGRRSGSYDESRLSHFGKLSGIHGVPWFNGVMEVMEQPDRLVRQQHA